MCCCLQLPLSLVTADDGSSAASGAVHVEQTVVWTQSRQAELWNPCVHGMQSSACLFVEHVTAASTQIRPGCQQARKAPRLPVPGGNRHSMGKHGQQRPDKTFCPSLLDSPTPTCRQQRLQRAWPKRQCSRSALRVGDGTQALQQLFLRPPCLACRGSSEQHLLCIQQHQQSLVGKLHVHARLQTSALVLHSSHPQTWHAVQQKMLRLTEQEVLHCVLQLRRRQ